MLPRCQSSLIDQSQINQKSWFFIWLSLAIIKNMKITTVFASLDVPWWNIFIHRWCHALACHKNRWLWPFHTLFIIWSNRPIGCVLGLYYSPSYPESCQFIGWTLVTQVYPFSLLFWPSANLLWTVVSKDGASWTLIGVLVVFCCCWWASWEKDGACCIYFGLWRCELITQDDDKEIMVWYQAVNPTFLWWRRNPQTTCPSHIIWSVYPFFDYYGCTTFRICSNWSITPHITFCTWAKNHLWTNVLLSPTHTHPLAIFQAWRIDIVCHSRFWTFWVWKYYDVFSAYFWPLLRRVDYCTVKD